MFRGQTLLVTMLFASLIVLAVTPTASTTVNVTIKSPYATSNSTNTIQCYGDLNINIKLIKSKNKTIIIIDSGELDNETLEYHAIYCISQAYPKLVGPIYKPMSTIAYTPKTATYTGMTTTKASPMTGGAEASTQTINLQTDTSATTSISSRDRIIVTVGVALLGGVILYILGNKLL